MLPLAGMWRALPHPSVPWAPATVALVTVALGAAALGGGCGYGWVQPDADPIPGVRLGVIDDTTPDGHLGLVAGDALRAAGVAAAGAGPQLGGVVQVQPEIPLAYGPDGTVGFSADVTVTLRLRGPEGVARTRGPDAVRRAVWSRGPSPLATRANRRAALEGATRAAATAALARWRAQLEAAAPAPTRKDPS